MGLFRRLMGSDINEKVAETRNDADAVLLDVRSREEFQAGHIEGAVNIPLQDLDKALRLYGSKNIYVYCASGARSGRAVSALKASGAARVQNIGGISSWRGPIVRS